VEVLLLREEDVRKALKLSRSKVYQMIASGELPAIRIGRSVRVPASALRSWIERQTADNTAAGAA
jgi:excisionase family DNA binding protein